MSGENGAVPDRYTLGVGGEASQSYSTPVGDVLLHLPTFVVGVVDGAERVSETRRILTIGPASIGGRDGHHHVV